MNKGKNHASNLSQKGMRTRKTTARVYEGNLAGHYPSAMREDAFATAAAAAVESANL